MPVVYVSPRLAILQALSQRGEDYGVAMASRIKRMTSGYVSLRGAGLYPVLWKLEEEGLVQKRRGPRNRGRGHRQTKVYALTPAGHAEAARLRIAFRQLFYGTLD